MYRHSECDEASVEKLPVCIQGEIQNSKDGKLDTVGIEQWLDHDLFVWSWFSGRCGTNNEKTLLAFSLLLPDILTGLPLNLSIPCVDACAIFGRRDDRLYRSRSGMNIFRKQTRTLDSCESFKDT